MCGRARSNIAHEKCVEAARSNETWVDKDNYRPAENVSPGFFTPIILMDEHGERYLHSMKWGLIPSYTKKGEKLDHYRMFNARQETVQEKPVFKRLISTKRCVVMYNGFYEWKKEGSGKVPHYIHLKDDQPIFMAGLYDKWEGPEGSLHSYTILTTSPSKRFSDLHNRMPVLLMSQQDISTWLDCRSQDALEKYTTLTKPYDGPELVWHPVTKSMSNPKYQKSDCSTDVRKKGIQSLFAKSVKSPGKTVSGKQSDANQDGNGDGERKGQKRKYSPQGYSIECKAAKTEII